MRTHACAQIHAPPLRSDLWTCLTFESVALLGISLLQQSAPELIAVVGFGENQLIVVSWQAVVDDHVHPVSIAPELHGSITRRLPLGPGSHPAFPRVSDPEAVPFPQLLAWVLVHTLRGWACVNVSLSGLRAP